MSRISHSYNIYYSDGLGDVTNRYPSLNLSEDAITSQEHPQLQFTHRSGVDVALDLVAAHPASAITYIALGPLTNLAQIVKKGGTTFTDRIGKIVVMGGNLDVPGNTSPVAECKYGIQKSLCHSVY